VANSLELHHRSGNAVSGAVEAKEGAVWSAQDATIKRLERGLNSGEGGDRRFFSTIGI